MPSPGSRSARLAVCRPAVAGSSACAAGPNGPLEIRPSDDDAEPAVDPGAGILGAILAGDPEIVNDIAADPRATAAERGFASLVAAPLRVRGERLGIIGTISREPVEFHASDLRLLGAIASLAAPTFEQAAVHEAALSTAGARTD